MKKNRIFIGCVQLIIVFSCITFTARAHQHDGNDLAIKVKASIAESASKGTSEAVVQMDLSLSEIPMKTAFEKLEVISAVSHESDRNESESSHFTNAKSRNARMQAFVSALIALTAFDEEESTTHCELCSHLKHSIECGTGSNCPEHEFADCQRPVGG